MQNADIVIVIDQRGIAQVVKHRYHPISRVEAEVTLTVTETRSKTYASLPEENLNLAPEAEVGALRRQVAVDPAGIRAVILDAIEHGRDVYLTGAKVDGTRYRGRRVTPWDLSPGYIDKSMEYLNCEDAASHARRRFRLDGIERVEVVE